MDKVTPLRCSVVMPTKDRVLMARTVLRCILNQTRRIDQLVIVDDGSLEPASSTLNDLTSQYLDTNIQVLHLRHEKSRGVSTARNAGFEAADGDIVMFCDSDDYWHPQKVELSMDHFERNTTSPLFVHAFRWIDGTQLLFKLLPEGKVIVMPRWLAILLAYANPSCMCIRKRGFGQNWDESKRYHEDLDFILHVMKSYSVTFRNSFLMTMGRAPGDSGGATQNLVAMRQGAIASLQDKSTNLFEWIILNFKVTYHRLRLWFLH